MAFHAKCTFELKAIISAEVNSIEFQASVPWDTIWRHGSASIILLGTTQTVTRAPILMYWAGLSRIASPRERRSKLGRG